MFAKLRKVSLNFVKSVCLSLPPSFHLHRTTWLDGFSLNLIFEYFLKISWENSHLIKNLTRITGTLHEGICTYMMISCWILRRKRDVSDESCRENQVRILSQPSHHCVMTEAWFQSQTSRDLWWAQWHWDRLFSKCQYKSTDAASSCLNHLMSMLCDLSSRWHDEIKHFCFSVWTVQVL